MHSLPALDKAQTLLLAKLPGKERRIKMPFWEIQKAVILKTKRLICQNKWGM